MTKRDKKSKPKKPKYEVSSSDRMWKDPKDGGSEAAEVVPEDHEEQPLTVCAPSETA